MSKEENNMNHKDMAKRLDIKSIFRCMMEGGYYPTYEKTHILFDIDDNTAVVEHEEGVVSIRIFFSIDESAYDLFLEASNATMSETFIVKPVVLNDKENIMFSFEMMCDTLKEFKKFFPRGVAKLAETLMHHKREMKRLMLTRKLSSATISATEDNFIISSKDLKPLT